MKNLTELREELGGLRTQITKQIDEWIDSLDQLTAFMGGGAVKKKKYTKRANGTASPALRERVKAHFREQRDRIDVRTRPNPNNITIPEAATMLGISEAGLRWQIHAGHLASTKEVRDTKGPKKGAQYPREVYVVARKAVEALARSISPSSRATPPTPKPPKKMGKLALQRLRSAQYLAQYDDTHPRVIPGRQLAPLVRRGYLKHAGDGYLRTGKEFGLAAPKKKPGINAKDRRELSAALLAKFDRDEPRPSSLSDKPNQIGVFVTRGYLRKKNGGYVRTAKEFTP